MAKPFRKLNQHKMIRIATLILSCSTLFLLSVVLTGCKKAFHVQIKNDLPVEVKVFSHTLGDSLADDIGNIPANSAFKPDAMFLDGIDNTDYYLDIQDMPGKKIGQVKQSQEQVHRHMSDGVWTVTIPDDFTSTYNPVLAHK